MQRSEKERIASDGGEEGEHKSSNNQGILRQEELEIDFF